MGVRRSTLGGGDGGGAGEAGGRRDEAGVDHLDVVEVVDAFKAAHHEVGDDVVPLLGVGAVVQWCSDAVVHWCSGAVVQRCMVHGGIGELGLGH